MNNRKHPHEDHLHYVIHDVSTVYDTSIIHDVSTVYETSVIENTVTETNIVYVEVPRARDRRVSHYEQDDMFRYKVYDNANEATLVSVVNTPDLCLLYPSRKDKFQRQCKTYK